MSPVGFVRKLIALITIRPEPVNIFALVVSIVPSAFALRLRFKSSDKFRLPKLTFSIVLFWVFRMESPTTASDVRLIAPVSVPSPEMLKVEPFRPNAPLSSEFIATARVEFVAAPVIAPPVPFTLTTAPVISPFNSALFILTTASLFV